MQIHEITFAKKNNVTSYAWGGYGFDLRSDVIWPDLAYRKTRIVESQNFDSWLANYAKNVNKPQSGDECILALLTHQANPMGPVRGFYGPATYVDETDQYYVLEISTGEHKYWKNNQIVFANKQDFEKFKVMLALKFGENFKGLEQTEVQESRDARTPTHVSEGLLDTVKAAYTGGGLGGVAKAMTSPGAYAQASQKGNLAQADKMRQQLEKQYGTKIQGSNKGKTPEELRAQVAADPKVKQAIQILEFEFFQKFFPGIPTDQIKEAGFKKSTFVKPSARIAASGRPPAIPVAKTSETIKTELNTWLATKVANYSGQLAKDPDTTNILENPLEGLAQQILTQNTSNVKASLANLMIAAKAASMYNSMLKKAEVRAGDIGPADDDISLPTRTAPTTAQLVAALKKVPRNEVDNLLKTAGLK